MKVLIKTPAVMIILILLMLTSCGCDSGEAPGLDDPVPDTPSLEDPQLPDQESADEFPFAEEPVAITTYYWPWISHGQLELSSGEIVVGPDLFESELGFIGEFTPERDFTGRLLWKVENTDVFSVQWISLTFDVDYFEDSEWISTTTFNFLIEDLTPETGDDGLQIFPTGLTDQDQNFVVTINRVLLGKEEEGSFTTEPLNYIALDLEMSVVENHQ